MQVTPKRRKLQLEDIVCYSSQNPEPFSLPRSRSTTPKNFHNTYNSTITPTKYATAASPCHTRKRGIMRQAIAERIQQYKKDHKKKYLRKTIEQVRQAVNQREEAELTHSPTISDNSRKIFQKISSKRNLSPKVLVRFEQYERSKSANKIKMKIQAYYKERHRAPKPQEIVSINNVGDIEQARRLIEDFHEKLNRYVREG